MMSPARKAVVFDLYGTLIDIRTDETDPGVWWALAQYLGYLGVAIGSEELKEQYQSRIDFQLKSSPHPHPETDVFAVFRDIFAAYGRLKVSREKIITAAMLFRSLSRRYFNLFPEVPAVLKKLRARYAVALVSDAQWVFTEPELEMTGLRDLFEVRVLSSRLGFKKPDPRLFAKALGALHVMPEQAVYVGDNPARDLVGAKRAGMKSVLFRAICPSLNGYQPDASFRDYGELAAVLETVLGPEPAEVPQEAAANLHPRR